MRALAWARNLVETIPGGPLGLEVDAMPEQLDLRVHDRVALDEIELYSEVLSAVAASDKPLTDEELDRVLGIMPVPHSRLRTTGGYGPRALNDHRRLQITGVMDDGTSRRCCDV
jgi:hypothetical protein